jgi:hypothetical protein
MFFCDWLQRREMLSPNKVALVDAVNDHRCSGHRLRVRCGLRQVGGV